MPPSPFHRTKEAAAIKAAKAKDSNQKELLECDNEGRAAIEDTDNARLDKDTAASKLESAQKRKATRETRLKKLRLDLEDAEKALAKLPATDPSANAELEDIRVRQRDVDRELRSVRESIQSVTEVRVQPQRMLDACAHKMKQLDGARGQRMQALGSIPYRGPNILKAADVVAEAVAAKRFKDTVYGPLACEVSVKTREAAAALEQQCEGHLWSSFVALNQEDMVLLQQLLLPLKITVLRHSGVTDRTFAHPVAVDMVTELGVLGTLDEFVEAPPAVKVVLADVGGISRAYLASAAGDKNVEELMRRNVGTLWTPSNQYVCTKSRHANVSSVRMVPLRQPRLLTSSGAGGSGAASAKADLQQQMAEHKAQIADINQRFQALDKDNKKLQGDLEELSRRKEQLTRQQRERDKERLKHQNAVKAKQDRLRSEEDDKHEDAEIARLKKESDSVHRKFVKHVLKSAALHMQTVDLMGQRCVSVLTSAELKEQVRALSSQLEGQSAAVKTAKELVGRAQQVHANDKEMALKLHKDAQAKAPLTPEREAAFVNMPNTVVELQDKIDTALAEADHILCPNPSVMQDYTRINSELTALEKTHTEKTNTLSGKQAVIDATKQAWLPKLQELFGRINTAFSAAMSAIGCAGEVRLSEAANDDFAAFAVEILVKFRDDGGLERLNPHRQSGGERSVSTMLYLISLQDLTRCPFRVVDEINQGMDPKNERKIFKQMVASACAPGTPQCFLLTPKLLPQLDYSPEVTVLAIFNGPWIKGTSTGFDSGIFIGNAA